MKTKSKKKEVAERLKLFAARSYGSIAALTRALNKNPNSLSSYIQAKSYPGLKLCVELERLGCDINWLMTGEDEKKAIKDIEFKNTIIELEKHLGRIAAALEKLTEREDG